MSVTGKSFLKYLDTSQAVKFVQPWAQKSNECEDISAESCGNERRIILFNLVNILKNTRTIA